MRGPLGPLAVKSARYLSARRSATIRVIMSAARPLAELTLINGNSLLNRRDNIRMRDLLPAIERELSFFLRRLDHSRAILPSSWAVPQQLAKATKNNIQDVVTTLDKSD